MTVDSEAIFALMEHERSSARALDKLYGSMASAWMDEREPDVVYLARGMGRPLWIGEGRHELFFASTKAALELVESYAGVSLVSREVSEGTLLSVRGGRSVGPSPSSPTWPSARSPSPPCARPRSTAPASRSWLRCRARRGSRGCPLASRRSTFARNAPQAPARPPKSR